jgi:hypothetical protein
MGVAFRKDQAQGAIGWAVGWLGGWQIGWFRVFALEAEIFRIKQTFRLSRGSCWSIKITNIKFSMGISEDFRYASIRQTTTQFDAKPIWLGLRVRHFVRTLNWMFEFGWQVKKLGEQPRPR